MRIPASESTAIMKPVKCENGHTFDAWYIRTPDGIVIEGFQIGHEFLPRDQTEEAYINGNCCFRAACETAWEAKLQI